jgi:heme oxygenase
MAEGLTKAVNPRAELLGLSGCVRLSLAMRERTANLHALAERTGIVNAILRGDATRGGYAILLRNLQPAYEALEQGLERRRHDPVIGPLARKEMYRTGALHADLATLSGDDWPRTLPLLAAGRKYRRRVAEVAHGRGSRLIAHAYVRYLGDLSGGQILKRLLGRSIGLGDRELTFYEFPRVSNHRTFKDELCDALDRVGMEIADFDAVVEEAAVAFELNIELSNAVLIAECGSPN